MPDPARLSRTARDEDEAETPEWAPDDPRRGASSRRRRRRSWAGGVATFVLCAVAAGGWLVRLPYYTISPGSSIDVTRRIEISGALSYRPEGEVRMLFVRERARVSVWRWVQASLDGDIDLFKEREFTGGQSPAQVRDEARADMLGAQFAARAVALQALGYHLGTGRKGVLVLYVFAELPAHGVLKEGDLIVAVDGRAVTTAQDLGEAIGRHKAGERARVTYVRDGRRRTDEVTTEAAVDDGRSLIGVEAVPPYEFPVDVKIDTDRIGGPSAGLAMTLAIIDDLAPGELTGGRVVAVTGTIDLDGNVGEIGGIAQKAGSARAAHATLFLVPKCHEGAYEKECEKDLRRAEGRAGDMKVVEVGTVEEALAAMRAAGGDPLRPSR